jgi:flagellar biosynthesis protein FlhG
MTADNGSGLRLRRISSRFAQAHAASRRGPRARVIAVTSGKGGVGKSNVSVNLAVKFASCGKEVVLLDADLGLANADVLCNVDLPCNLAHVIARRKSLMEEIIVRAPGGFGLIGGASGLARMADLTDFDRQRVVDSLADLEEQTDLILIDTGAGISPNVLSFTRAADHVLVVTTPSRPPLPTPTPSSRCFAAIVRISRSACWSIRPDRRRRRLVVYDRIAAVARQFLSVHDSGRRPRERRPASLRRRPQAAFRSCLAPRIRRPRTAFAPSRARLEGSIGPVDDGGFFRRMVHWLSKVIGLEQG